MGAVLKCLDFNKLFGHHCFSIILRGLVPAYLNIFYEPPLNGSHVSLTAVPSIALCIPSLLLLAVIVATFNIHPYFVLIGNSTRGKYHCCSSMCVYMHFVYACVF